MRYLFLQLSAFILFSNAQCGTHEILIAHQEERIVCSKEEMEEHKRQCKEKILANPATYQDPTYQLQRALGTISADDCDSIAKVPLAGEIFDDEDVSYQLMHNGVKIMTHSYYDVQWLTDVIYGLKGHHEPQEEQVFHEVLKYMPENATMLELGSYWGYYSLWFAQEIKGNVRNYLVEPDVRRLEIGRKNFELNQKTGIFRRGYVGVFSDTGHYCPDITGAEYISIDSFMEQEGIDHVNLLHADVQGGEYGMLLSCIEHLKDIDYFVISTHDYWVYHLPCLNFLEAHGYVILAEHTPQESCSCDGLIVARRADVFGPDQIFVKKY